MSDDRTLEHAADDDAGHPVVPDDTGDSSECASGAQLAPRTASWTVLLFALLFPTLLTLAYFVLLDEFSSGVQQAVYGVGKCVQFGFPILFALLVLRYRPTRALVSMQGVAVGLTFGAAVLTAMLLLYTFWLKGSPFLQGLETQVVDKVKGLGLDSFSAYVATGVFYSLAHSLLEEYYWRWFVFGQMQPRIGVPKAIAISSLGFMAHHVILLATFFGWGSPLTYLFSLAVAVGGVFWAWLYSSSRSLLGPWVSHVLIDAAIFLIGYDLIRAALS